MLHFLRRELKPLLWLETAACAFKSLAGRGFADKVARPASVVKYGQKSCNLATPADTASVPTCKPVFLIAGSHPKKTGNSSR